VQIFIRCPGHLWDDVKFGQIGGAGILAGDAHGDRHTRPAWCDRPGRVDKIVAGTAQTPVRGIATTMMSTFDVLQRAVAKGRNFIITHEPTFYNHLDATDQFSSDPTYQAKQRFIKENIVVIFRFHDHAHALQPDPLVAGSARMLGWTQYASPTEPRSITTR